MSKICSCIPRFQVPIALFLSCSHQFRTKLTLVTRHNSLACLGRTIPSTITPLNTRGSSSRSSHMHFSQLAMPGMCSSLVQLVKLDGTLGCSSRVKRLASSIWQPLIPFGMCTCISGCQYDLVSHRIWSSSCMLTLSRVLVACVFGCRAESARHSYFKRKAMNCFRTNIQGPDNKADGCPRYVFFLP